MLERLALALVAFMGITGAASAAGVCYDKINVPAHLECKDSSSNSADFTTGCKWIDAHVKTVERPCPERWVNVSAITFKGSAEHQPSHAAVCASAGLTPTYVEGQSCASGRLRPRVGENWAAISYKYGTVGGGGTGGVRTETSMIGYPVTTQGGWGTPYGISRKKNRICNSTHCYYTQRKCQSGGNSDKVNCRPMVVAVEYTTTSCLAPGQAASSAQEDAVVAFLCKAN